MKLLNFIVQKKEAYASMRNDFRADVKVANKLGFVTEVAKLERDKNFTIEILDLLEEIAVEIQKERVFTESQISNLQSEVHKITGDGDVMQLFNSLLGINAGADS